MIGEYTDSELEQLHGTLYEILAELIRVCQKLDINYFIVGGSCIGAYFEKAILSWDDDIDVGMARTDYERFLKEAPAELNAQFFLQYYHSDPHTIYYFAKLMKRNTLFEEKMLRHINVQQGIYVDIFPFDKMPNNKVFYWLQRRCLIQLNHAFIAKEIWPWRNCRRCTIEKPEPKGFLACAFTWLLSHLLPKSVIYSLIQRILGAWRNSPTKYSNIIMVNADIISNESITHLETRRFGPLQVKAPSDLKTYLTTHYHGLSRYVPKEKQRNHHPWRLSFNTTDKKTSTK